MWHATIRKARGGAPLDLRAHNSVPPTPDEMSRYHSIFRGLLEDQMLPPPRSRPPMTITAATYLSSYVIYPEQRNVHGKLFGGWVAGDARVGSRLAGDTCALCLIFLVWAAQRLGST
eukprot:COSAG01_NODE_2313_length_7933_cov_79.874777_5_plen_117_part_00